MSTRVSSEPIIARDGGDGSSRMQKGQNAWWHITCGRAAAYSQSLNAFFRGPSLPQDKLKPIFLLDITWGLKSPPPKEFKSGKQARAKPHFPGSLFPPPSRPAPPPEPPCLPPL